jgi:hypothetical protein
MAEQGATAEQDQRVLENLKSYWLREYPDLPANTRSCIVFGLLAMVDILRSRGIYEMLCTDTFALTPELIFNGRIVIMDLPVKEFGDAGILVQSSIGYLVQKAVERRPDQGDATRPIFVWQDEAAQFFTEFDPIFQQTARSSRVARVMLSQNLNSFYAHLGGGEHARHLFDSFVGNMNTRILHANGDALTNRWAAEMFGTREKPTSSSSATSSESDNPFATLFPGFNPPKLSHSQSSHREPLVFPSDFAQLRTGGEENNFLADAYVYRVGAPFKSTGRSFMKATFQQQFI